jgi:putative SOS response-associated peptidase YedK
MCTRFSCKLTLETVEAFFAALADLSRPPPALAQGEFALGEAIPVIPAGARRTLTARRWGWPKAEGGLLANARSESLASKPYFARHADARRCVIPASGFYESRAVRGAKEPWFFALKSSPVFGLAGLLSDAGDVVLLTTEPNACVKPIHRRMPALLRADLLSGWLDPALPLLDLPTGCLDPWPDEDMRAQPPAPTQPELF